MLRRILRLTLALSLAAGAVGATADARGFAQPPAQDQPTEVGLRPSDDLPPPKPLISYTARAKVRAILAARRAKNIASFRAYALRGVYPHNYVRRGSLNVWTDRDGHMCAAATMIFKSGQKALVRKIAKTNNNVRLLSVTDGPLVDWSLMSGLTRAEIDAIQAPMVMPPNMPEQPVDGTPTDWRVAEDQKLRQHYDQVLVDLAASTDASLEAAIDALATRPDLIAKLIS